MREEGGGVAQGDVLQGPFARGEGARDEVVGFREGGAQGGQEL